MSFLFDPVGFVADCIAIGNALGWNTPAQKAQLEAVSKLLNDVDHTVVQLKDLVSNSTNELKTLITTATVIEVRSRVNSQVSMDGCLLETLIKLLFLIKSLSPNVVFAIFVRYKIGVRIATLGVAGTSSDSIETLVIRFDNFLNGLRVITKPKTAYISVRLRGKFDCAVENFCSAALIAIATEVCSLSRDINVDLITENRLTAVGARTVALLTPLEASDDHMSCDMLSRVFLVGDTRTGKSTLGNAMLSSLTFTASKGMTGTLRIERGQRMDVIDGDVYIMEIYDTPGLNDKDGLDVFYQSAIEDKIRILQRANALIMTVDVDSGITHSMARSIADYKKLFGDSIASMLVLVLTIKEEEADTEQLDDILEANWPDVLRLDNKICKKNVFCVSLTDLRKPGSGSASHKVIDRIVLKSQRFPMKLIDSLRSRYDSIRESLRENAGNVQERVQELVDQGWLAYDELCRKYETSPYVKMTDNLVTGFVMKHMLLPAVDKLLQRTAANNVMYNMGSFGFPPAVRKTAVHVTCDGKRARKVWEKFLNKNSSHSHRSDLMTLFGEEINNQSLAVTVNDLNVTYAGTLRVKMYQLRVFDPFNHEFEELNSHLHSLLQDGQEPLREDVIAHLFQSAVPPAQRQWRKVKSYGGHFVGCSSSTSSSSRALPNLEPRE